jgi:hypothetical protein
MKSLITGTGPLYGINKTSQNNETVIETDLVILPIEVDLLI